jgi:hypothetical protein
MILKPTREATTAKMALYNTLNNNLIALSNTCYLQSNSSEPYTIDSVPKQVRCDCGGCFDTEFGAGTSK